MKNQDLKTNEQNLENGLHGCKQGFFGTHANIYPDNLGAYVWNETTALFASELELCTEQRFDVSSL